VGSVPKVQTKGLELDAAYTGAFTGALRSAAEHALLAHSWPGSIRELENVVQGIFTFSSRFLHPVAGTILGWAYATSAQ
jgi:hypothetical protein